LSDKTIDERVETLEKEMDSLRELPAQVSDLGTTVSGVESQILQLRTDMSDGFSATLQIIESSSKATQTMFDETQKIVREGDEETRRQMRVLHEDLVKRIVLLGEARRRPRKG